MLVNVVENISLGVVKQGTITNGSFSLRNVGTEDAIITKISSSCGCTTTKNYQNTIIKANQTMSFDFSFNSANKSGQQMKSIQVRYKIGKKENLLIQRININIEK